MREILTMESAELISSETHLDRFPGIWSTSHHVPSPPLDRFLPQETLFARDVQPKCPDPRSGSNNDPLPTALSPPFRLPLDSRDYRKLAFWYTGSHEFLDYRHFFQPKDEAGHQSDQFPEEGDLDC